MLLRCSRAVTDQSQILQISIYVNLNDVSMVSFGRRSTVYPGLADFESLIEKDLMFSRQLSELGPERKVLGSLATRQRHSVKDHEIGSAEHRPPHTLNAGHA